MIPKSQIDQTVERFQVRTLERQETEAKLTTGSPLTANTPARVDQRLARIMAVESANVAFAPVEAAVAAPVTVNVIERALGSNDLIEPVP
jgi:formylmethanofuran dehydrogenase subunit B